MTESIKSGGEVMASSSGHIGWLTINRPHSLNALSRATIDAFVKNFIEFDNNSDIRVIVVSGAGEKSFCSGVDLKESASSALTRLLCELFHVTSTKSFSKP